LKRASFFEAAGQYQKLARAKNRKTIGRFSFAKSLKHTVQAKTKKITEIFPPASVWVYSLGIKFLLKNLICSVK
jgi:hypothetical protein